MVRQELARALAQTCEDKHRQKEKRRGMKRKRKKSVEGEDDRQGGIGMKKKARESGTWHTLSPKSNVMRQRQRVVLDTMKW